jgi:hypothetical protein
MPTVTVQLSTFKGFAIAPDDVTFGEAETKEIEAVQNCVPIKTQFVRRSATVKLRGLTRDQALVFIDEAKNTPKNIANNVLVGQDITFNSGIVLKEAYLVKATPTEPIQFNTTWVMPSLELEYHSKVFD